VAATELRGPRPSPIAADRAAASPKAVPHYRSAMAWLQRVLAARGGGAQQTPEETAEEDDTEETPAPTTSPSTTW
jgi:hypothetical protein